MGTLAEHVARHVPVTVVDKTPAVNSGLAGSNARADNQHFAGVHTATDENGVMGTPKGSPGRINARLNGVKVE